MTAKRSAISFQLVEPPLLSGQPSLSSGKKDSIGDVQGESRTTSSPKVSAEKDSPSYSGSANAPRQTEASHTTSEKPGDEERAALVKMQSLEAQEELEKQLNELSKSKVFILLVT